MTALILAVCGGVIAVAVPGLCWQLTRALRNSVDQAAARPASEAPAIDRQPGVRLDLRDEYERIWATPARPGLRLDELRQLIRDEQQKGDLT